MLDDSLFFQRHQDSEKLILCFLFFFSPQLGGNFFVVVFVNSLQVVSIPADTRVLKVMSGHRDFYKADLDWKQLPPPQLSKPMFSFGLDKHDMTT